MISLHNITKYYYSSTSVALGVRKVNLDFKLGEFVAITGESGSGKSTLLNVISGMDSYEDGEMYMNGEATSYFDEHDWENYRREHISFIYQSYNLIDSYTVLENIESVLLICESKFGQMSAKERKDYCLSYLDKVGLKKKAHQRASHLSSGQKQRLSIARALAKNTDIIIADEPTGNLDSENGAQIIKLLHELSKEKLVIMVTHNYEQVADYVTRKIRMYDGEVVEDIYPNKKVEQVQAENQSGKVTEGEQKANSEDQSNENNQNDEQNKETSLFDVDEKNEKKGASWKLAWKFVWRNRKAQPHRNFFIFLFLILSAAANLIFLGTFLKNVDDTSTKIVSNDVFFNTDMKRLVLRKLDGSNVTEKDLKKVNELEYVEGVDLYDGISDVNYFYRKNVDYKLNYDSESSTKKIEPEYLDKTQFMRSSSSLTKDDLAKGELPDSFSEIVLYSDDESKLGEEITFYFQNTRFWNDKQSAAVKLKVVGLLKEKSSQVYFAQELCRALNVRYTDYMVDANYCKVKEVDYLQDQQEDYRYETDTRITAIFIPAEDLSGKVMRISQNYFLNTTGELLTYDTYTQKTYIDSKGTIDIRRGEEEEETIEVQVEPSGNLSTSYVVEVSQELFDTIYSNNEMKQMSVFIEDYAYTDEVIQALDEAGYEAMSVFRISATSYDPDKVTERFVTLGISAGALVIIFFLDILVIYALMKLKRGDFLILKSLGMKQKLIRRINILDLVSAMFIMQMIVAVIAKILAMRNVEFMNSFMKYYQVSNWCFLWGIGVLMSIVTALFYNRYLHKHICKSSGI